MAKERAKKRHCSRTPAARQEWNCCRSTGPPCNCRAKCFEQVDPKLQYHILTAFNHLPDKDKQDQYLRGNIVASDPTWVGTQGRGGKYSESNKGRKNTKFQYYVPTGKIRSIPKADILRTDKKNKCVCSSYDLCICFMFPHCLRCEFWNQL